MNEESYISTDNGIVKITQIVGKGAYGNVFKGINEDTEDTVAIKRITLKEGDGISYPLESFIMSSFNHKYINQAIEIQILNDEVLLIQDLAKMDLHYYCKNKNINIPNKQILIWYYQILQGLHCLHNKNILHGDIKSSNILLFPDGNVKLCDYSLSAILKEDNTPFIHTLYTMTHRPPEIFNKKVWSFKSDVWALGCTFYEILYGTYLFQGQKTEKQALNCIHDYFEKEEYDPTIAFNNRTKKWIKSNDELNDVIKSMIVYDHNERPSVNTLLGLDCFKTIKKHPYLFIEMKEKTVTANQYSIYNAELRQSEHSEHIDDVAFYLYSNSVDKVIMTTRRSAESSVNLACKMMNVSLGKRLCDLEDEIAICNSLNFKLF